MIPFSLSLQYHLVRYLDIISLDNVLRHSLLLIDKFSLTSRSYICYYQIGDLRCNKFRKNSATKSITKIRVLKTAFIKLLRNQNLQ